MLFSAVILGLACLHAAHGAPASPTISNQAQLNSALSALSAGPTASFAAGYTSLLSAVSPTATPTNVAQASSLIAAAHSAYPSNPLAAGAALVLNGLNAGKSFSANNPAADVEDFGTCNSASNTNTAQPSKVVYPKASPNDAPYDLSESALRSAIYIPPGFKYGSVRPAIFIPGTGVEACENFAPNLGKLFTGSSYADPVYVNIPNNMLMDIQTNAEYIAYAINYISGISGNKNVSVVSWSQGGPATQWALKYWPSTRSVVSDFVAISPDYHGTIEVPLICPPGVPCAPSILQQFYTSNFIQTLRNNGGDSAYVPTTTLHSIFDEIVEPQQDPLASADLNDSRAVGVTNEQVQNSCPPGTPAGGPNFGHENLLYNPISFVLARDALQNNGPGNVARSQASTQCANFQAQGLTLEDVFATEFLILLAGFNFETYPNKVLAEPPIKSYAAADQP